MIIGETLQAWLADRRRQRGTRAAADDFARDWGRGAVHTRFDQALANIPSQTAEAVADAIRTLFADDGWLDALIDGLAAEMQRDPYFEPPFRALNTDVHSGLLVFEDERVTIAAGVSCAAQLAAKKSARRGATSVGLTGQLTVLKFVKAGGALLSFWEAPRIDAGFTAADAGICVRTGEKRLRDGDILTIDGRHRTYVIEQARANLVVLQASITLDQAPLSVEYDSASGSYVGCSATGDGASRIQMIASLLRKLDCDGAFEAVAAFIGHPDFFVRWHVMRELLGIDAAAALPHLKRMAARDPHPDARRAARAVLDGLTASQTSKAA